MEIVATRTLTLVVKHNIRMNVYIIEAENGNTPQELYDVCAETLKEAIDVLDAYLSGYLAS